MQKQNKNIEKCQLEREHEKGVTLRIIYYPRYTLTDICIAFTPPPEQLQQQTRFIHKQFGGKKINVANHHYNNNKFRQWNKKKKTKKNEHAT